jgi:hypothetical protein
LINFTNRSLDECTVGNGNDVQPCYHAACSWYYTTDAQDGEGKCENKDPQILSMLDLTTEIRMFIKHKQQEETKPSRAIFKHRSFMKFWCELNNCNNQKVGEAIKEAVNEQYDLWSVHKIYQIDRQ